MPMYAISHPDCDGVRYLTIQNGEAKANWIQSGESGDLDTQLGSGRPRKGPEFPLDLSFEEMKRRWRTRLEALVTEFEQGEAQVRPLGKDSCTYCGLESLCRIYRKSVLPHDELLLDDG